MQSKTMKEGMICRTTLITEQDLLANQQMINGKLGIISNQCNSHPRFVSTSTGTHSSDSSADFDRTENCDTLNSESVLSKNMLSQFASKDTHSQNDVMTMIESSNQSAGSTHAPESTSNINVADVQAVDQITGRYEDVTGRDDFQETGETKTGHGVSKMESTQTGGIMDFEESRRGDNIPSSVPVQDNSREKTHCLDTSTSEEGGYHGNSDVADEINETGVQDDTTDDYQNEVDSLSESSVQSKRSGSKISRRPKRKKRHVNRPKNQGDCLSESSVESKTSGSQTSKQPKRKKRRSNRPEMTEQELETHKERIRKSMIDDKPHICEKCGKGYKTQQGLSVHLSVGICVRQKCKYCGLEFLYKDWQNHLVDVHAEQIRVSQCDHCDKLFTGRSTKSHHIETQHSKGRYECDICKSVFTYQRGLVLHKQSHSEKTLQCRHCPARFVKEAKRMEHERRVHNEVLSVCTECGETFNTKIKMIYHHQTVHLKPEFECSVCGKKFKDKYYWQAHLEHHGELSKEYTCEICKKTFRIRSEYRSHCRRVCKKRDFLCDVCGRRLKTSSSLRTHVQTHGEASIKCELCPRVFKQESCLKSHVKSAHSDEKPWQCDVCGYRCKLRENLMKHTRIHNK
ncbi:zinc finger protein 77-like [Ptychodera flava]|uniref:zinc finger protein 77-like n=1 Tax=Ptychodera flava TaxID=63121 RepID=UPI00396AA8D4